VRIDARARTHAARAFACTPMHARVTAVVLAFVLAMPRRAGGAMHI
jgi:hypothetical protein